MLFTGCSYLSDNNLIKDVNKDADSAENAQSTNTSVEESNNYATGIFIGNSGSVFTFFDDGTADYYWTGFNEVYSDNKWTYDNGVITVHLDVLKCDVTADVPNEDFSSLLFVSDSKNWDDEEFEKISERPQKLTAKAYSKMFESDDNESAKSAS